MNKLALSAVAAAVLMTGTIFANEAIIQKVYASGPPPPPKTCKVYDGASLSYEADRGALLIGIRGQHLNCYDEIMP